MRRIKTKLMLLVAVLITIFYFTGDFSLIDIQKTAIIVAIGIDKLESDFEVTAQIAVAQATDKSAQNNDALISAKGKTVFEAIDNIGINTGWQPKLSFCDLIILGEKATKEHTLSTVDYVLSSQKLQNSALIATCEGTAKELLSQATALDAISSFAIQKILLRNTLKANTVIKSTVREFAMLHYSQSACGFMPKIKAEKDAAKGDENSSSSQMASTGSGSGSSSGQSGSGGGEKQSVIFNASTTAIFSNGKYVCDIGDDESLVLSLLQKQVDESFITVEVDGDTKLLSITENSHNVNVKFLEKPTVDVSLNLKVAIEDGTESISSDNINRTQQVAQKYLTACEEKIAKIIGDFFQKFKENNADILGAKNIIYKFHYAKFPSVKDLHLSNFDLQTHITVKSLD